MGLRLFLWLVLGLCWRLSSAEPTGAYQPPLLLSAPLPVASSPALQNAYQPPIARARSVDYRSPLEKASPQTYSVVYTPPETLRNPSHGGVSFQHQSNALPTSFHESVSSISQPDHAKSLPTSYQNSAGSIATSYSVHQQPASIERTYSQGSAPSQQTIHKAPASEIQSEKSPLAADRDGNKKEEYVVYYYYYYDNDTASGNNANNNLSLSFDDIPSLESYDQDVAKPGQKEPEKSANALSPDQKFDAPPLSSQGRSVSGSVDRSPPDETFAQPLRPVPNVFRYGSNEVPRFPVLPNFVVSQAAPPTETPPPPTADGPPTTQPTFNGVDLDNELNNHVLDPRPEETSTSTTTPVPETTTTTTEEITTTEATTTTERPRRRPPVGGGRRRFNSNSSPSPRPRSTTSSTVAPSSTTRAAPSGRFQGNRVRSRPAPGGFGRSRTASRTTEEDSNSVSDSSSTQAPPSSSSTTPASRNRFTSQAPRRFQSSRSRSQSSSSSSTSTTSTTTRTPQRTRTTSRPRPNIIGNRSRPPRPGFLRPRNPEPETTTPEPETTDAPEESLAETPAREDQDDESEAAEDNEEEEEETEAPPTTTEASRFSALFKPRNRANRPRSPLLGNRPPRV